MGQAPSNSYLGDDIEELTTSHNEEDTEGQLGSEGEPSSSTKRRNYGTTENASVNASTISGRNHGRQQSDAVVPEFGFLEISDTGYFVPWTPRAIRKLKPGDEVAWLRPGSYYHHAIVCGMKGDSITVIEKTRTSITDSRKPLTEKSWLSGQLYKVHYPDDVLRKNPARKVLKRAYRSLQGKGFQLSNNCEHFTTWCKVGQKQSKQYKQKCFNWGTYCSRRLLQSAVHIPLVIFLSDFVEEVAALSDLFGVMLLVFVELLYLILVCLFIMNDVDKGQDFIANQPQSIGKRMKCAFYKTLFQSIFLVFMAAVLGVGVKDILITCLGPWRRHWPITVTLEFGLGMLGALLGNIFGFFLFFFSQHRTGIKFIKPHICPDHDGDTTPPSLDSSDSSDGQPEDHNVASGKL